MISRLVLVGIVGAFGVSLPTQSEQSAWFAAARAWAGAQLAQWNFAASSGPARPVSSPASAGHPKTLAFEPIAPDTASVENDLAYRLIRMTEAAPIRPIAKTAKIVKTAIVKTIAFEPIAPDTASVENDLAYRLIRMTEASRIGPAADPANDLAIALNLQADGTAARPSASVARAPKFEPIATPEGPEWGLAGRLNRMSDGLALADDADTARTSGAGIGAALRLTRDAACAWMTVLTGPAVVHVSQR